LVQHPSSTAIRTRHNTAHISDILVEQKPTDHFTAGKIEKIADSTSLQLTQPRILWELDEVLTSETDIFMSSAGARIFGALEAFRMEVPSWGFANTGLGSESFSSRRQRRVSKPVSQLKDLWDEQYARSLPNQFGWRRKRSCSRALTRLLHHANCYSLILAISCKILRLG